MKTRDVQSEQLDELSPADPAAVRSRGDLRRLNRIMGNPGILAHALLRHSMATPASPVRLRLLDLGSGDGTALLRIARILGPAGLTAEATLLDRLKLVTPETDRAFTALGWTVKVVAADAYPWLMALQDNLDVMVANLFLHHFPDRALADLLQAAAAVTRLFVACEPRRSATALAASRLVGLIGCNGVTRHDAVASVRGGFAGSELSALWPTAPNWELHEDSAGFFSHRFIAQRNA
jgi:SAM-dependent methyltransferase